MAEQFMFRPRKSRMTRLERYAGLVESIHAKADGMVMVTKPGTWNPFSAYLSELTPLAKPIHGNPGNLTYNNDGSFRTCDNNDSK